MFLRRNKNHQIILKSSFGLFSFSKLLRMAAAATPTKTTKKLPFYYCPINVYIVQCVHCMCAC